MKVLFICQFNSVRSPMAEGLLRKQMGSKVHVQSCGLTPEAPNELRVTIMNEVGIDMSGHQAKSLADMGTDTFDRIIAFTAGSKAGAEAVLGAINQEIELWAVPNPGEGSLDMRALLNNYRAIRANIQARLMREFT